MKKLIASRPSRVIVMSSSIHHFGHIDFDNLQMERKVLNSFQVYGNTKLANLLFVRELDRRIPSSLSVTVNALHPGLVKTDIVNEHWLGKALIRPILYPLAAKTVVEGAQTAVHLALSPQLERVSGKYFTECRQTKPSMKAMDDNTAKYLWEVSERLTGQKFIIDKHL